MSQILYRVYNTISKAFSQGTAPYPTENPHIHEMSEMSDRSAALPAEGPAPMETEEPASQDLSANNIEETTPKKSEDGAPENSEVQSIVRGILCYSC